MHSFAMRERALETLVQPPECAVATESLCVEDKLQEADLIGIEDLAQHCGLGPWRSQSILTLPSSVSVGRSTRTGRGVNPDRHNADA
jgi:hypothetical protein